MQMTTLQIQKKIREKKKTDIHKNKKKVRLRRLKYVKQTPNKKRCGKHKEKGGTKKYIYIYAENSEKEGEIKKKERTAA